MYIVKTAYISVPSINKLQAFLSENNIHFTTVCDEYVELDLTSEILAKLTGKYINNMEAEDILRTRVELLTFYNGRRH